MKKPNIVFIMADQLAAAFLGCYGSGVDSTPTLDELAEKGVRFGRCYSHVPVCAPNRATMLTGRSVDVHGLTTNNLLLTNDNPTYAQVFQENGYRVGGFGKFHLTPMQQPLPPDFSYLGFDESVPTEDPKLGPWLDWIEEKYPEYFDTALAMSWPMPYIEKYGKNKVNLKPLWEEARKKIIEPRRNTSEWSLMYPSPLPKELHQTTYITNLGIDFMERHLAHYPNQPFFCQISYVDPHDPYDPPVPYDTMYCPDDMPSPIAMTWREEDCKPLENSRGFHNFKSLDNHPEAINKLRALYHGSIRFVDDQIKRVVDFIKDRGMWENTILIFTTDHGDMMGDHGLITKGVKHYDKGIRCPLIAYGGKIMPGVNDGLRSSLDIYPTFCDFAGINRRPPLEGKSFAPICWGNKEEDGWKEVTVQFPSSEEGSVYSIITEDNWRLTVYQEMGQGQMFDLNRDPTEQCNLFYNTELLEKKVQLLERLIRAYMRPGTIQRYRNLPLDEEGQKCTVRGFNLIKSF